MFGCCLIKAIATPAGLCEHFSNVTVCPELSGWIMGLLLAAPAPWVYPASPSGGGAWAYALSLAARRIRRIMRPMNKCIRSTRLKSPTPQAQHHEHISAAPTDGVRRITTCDHIRRWDHAHPLSAIIPVPAVGPKSSRLGFTPQRGYNAASPPMADSSGKDASALSDVPSGMKSWV